MPCPCDEPPCGPVPIELISFSVTHEDNKAIIEYQTGLEVNSDYVTIFASIDAEIWHEVIRIPSTCPNGCNYLYEDLFEWLALIQ